MEIINMIVFIDRLFNTINSKYVIVFILSQYKYIKYKLMLFFSFNRNLGVYVVLLSP